MTVTRRNILMGFAGVALLSPQGAHANHEALELVKQLTGRTATESDRLHLIMPAVFPTGYTVPMSVDVDSPMTETDHVRQIRVFAPQNPLIEVGSFHFTPQRSLARVSTRIRLAKPQHVIAVAEMNDGVLLMTTAWVHVATDGCA
jgi:sulfur-oxidizing protein SoxY